MTRRELVWTHALDGTQNGVIGRDFIDFYTDNLLDQGETLNFTIPVDHPKAYLLAEDLLLRHRGRRYTIAEITRGRRGTQAVISVEANALWYRLGEIDYVGSLVLDSVPPSIGLITILEGSGWTAATERVDGIGSHSMEQQDKSLLALVRAWAKVTGYYVQFDTMSQEVVLTATRGATLGVAFRKGRNLRDVNQRRRPPATTVLYPYGVNDLTIAGVNGGAPYVEDFTFYTDQGISLATARELYTKRRVWVDSTFIKDTDLLPAASARLATMSQRIEEIELGVVDISEITGVTENIEPGDTVVAQDPDFDDQFSAIVTRYKRYWLQPWRNQIELSSSPQLVDDPSESSGRDSLADEWIQFVGPVSAAYQIRNDGDFITNRIPLRFREGGRANFHLDLWATGVGAGNMVVTVEDAENADEQQFKQVTVPYTNGATARATLSWATEELSGAKDYRVVVTTVASGGPSTTNGVNIAIDATDPVESSFWILAQGAVQETPTEPNSQTFNYTGAVQTFTVPDNITQITILAYGAEGSTSGAPTGGGGGMVTASFVVVPGTVYDVYVGGDSSWPNGGNGGSAGGLGGGSSDVRPTGTGMASAIIVAAGGGGAGEPSGSNPTPNGGDGGFMQGANGYNTGQTASAIGATQFAGGSGGSAAGQDGSFGEGGDGADGTGFDFDGGGGGGGWYGGEGGDVGGGGNGQTGGGGGSGWLASGAFDIELADGARTGDGQVVISWTEATI